MASAFDTQHQSLEAFLAWEEQQPERYERVGGRVWMMTGGTLDHNRITLNVVTALRSRLKDPSCEVFITDVKVITPGEDVMYPDVIVACGRFQGRSISIEAPVVIVEVLSQSTAARDQGFKRWAYATIPSLRHYVVIVQDEPVVEVASPNPDGSWRSVFHRGLEARLRLDALEVEIGLDEIFARTGVAEPQVG
jgi:Uma2 family endonuclease